MKDKTKIIYLVSFVMTKDKWFGKEINYLEENGDIEVHELCDFLFPGSRSTLKESHKSKKIFSFKTFLEWKNYVLNLQQKCIKEKKKLVILSELSKYPTSQGYRRLLQPAPWIAPSLQRAKHILDFFMQPKLQQAAKTLFAHCHLRLSTANFFYWEK